MLTYGAAKWRPSRLLLSSYQHFNQSRGIAPFREHPLPLASDSSNFGGAQDSRMLSSETHPIRLDRLVYIVSNVVL